MISWISRQSEKEISHFIQAKEEHKNVGILIGARQVGKSSLVEKVIGKKAHLLLNLEKNSSFAEQIDHCEDFEDFEDYLKEQHHFDAQKQILVIDEAQQSLKLGSFIRFMKESWKKATVLLTGSTASEIYSAEIRSAVGRETFFELWPLNFKEFLRALEQDSLVKTLENFELGQNISESKHERFLDYYTKYLQVGGLPAVVLAYKEGKDYQKTRSDIFKSYEDDFVRYFSLDEVNLFKRCLDAVAANVGSPSKDSQAIRLDAPGYKKIAGIFARLEKWKLLIKCDQVGRSPEASKLFPKRYLFDVGILSQLRLRGIQDIHLKEIESPVLRTPLGGILENALALSFRIQFGESLFGLKLSTQSEVDFAIKINGNIYPLECKLALKFKLNHLSALKTALETVSPKGEAFLFYGGRAQEKSIGKIWVLPFYLADEVGRLIEHK